MARLRFTGCSATRFRWHWGWIGVRSEGILDGLQRFFFQVDVSEVVAHEADQPDPVFDFADADGLSGEGFGKVDFLSVKTDAATAGDHHGAVMKRVMRLGEALVGPG